MKTGDRRSKSDEQLLGEAVAYLGEVGAAGEAADDGLTVGDQALLRLLAQGKKQADVARVLNLSERTVNRRIGVLMRRIGVCSPFQLGVEASRRGWL